MGLIQRLFGGRTKADVPGPQASHRLIPGYEDLEVVGESHYQDALHAIVGYPTTRIRAPVDAILVAETDNQYDANAVSVWIEGRKVGHLSRDDAAAIRPGLLRLQQQAGTWIAVSGTIVGGDILGVFLNFDPAEFGLPAPPRRGFGATRTGRSQAIERDLEDGQYDMDLPVEFPEDPQAALQMMLERLRGESEPVARHFLYAGFEGHMYSVRDVPVALDLFDQLCEQHHAEMTTIRAALIDEFGDLPLIEVYKQATIRHQKAHDWARAIEWAERGIRIYGANALNAENVTDLRNRVTKCQAKLEAAAATVRSTGRNRKGSGTRIAEATTETLSCERCGQQWERVLVRGRKPRLCPDCLALSN